MTTLRSRRTVCMMGSVVLAVVGLHADTLHLRDGRRVEGQLVGIRNGTIEFEERRSFGSFRTLRLDLDDVRRIDFDEERAGRNNFNSRGDRGFDSQADPGRRPGGLREREVIVGADLPFHDTNIDVRAGQVVYFSATGRVNWGPGRRDGPEGEGNSPFNATRPIPRRPAAALIGKVGSGSTDYFFIGNEQGPVQIRGSGRLFLGINDDYLQDNSGNFRVTVYY